MYQATLVSDQTPFDTFAEGNGAALTAQQLMGWGVFTGKGKCASCHGGAAFTNASIHRRLITDRMNRMTMGNGGVAVYDEGFYNIGVTPTAEDIGVGGNDPFGNPLSFSGLAKKSALLFNLYEQALPNQLVTSLTRIAVQGAFKTPGLRNVELTAPYFHNGGTATLAQVIEFYNRGGNFARANLANLDADIQPLGLSATEKESLVAFLKALTDERVRKHAAPFDHPQLRVTNGHPGDTSTVTNDGWGRATDAWLDLPAVGRSGYSADRIPASFLGLAQ
jgi:cytochrome c peroxidase